MKLSIAVIAKNEEKNIRRLLESLEPLKNEILFETIIVDTGSTDNTISISKEYTDKIYEHKWNNDFAYMRNISIKYCKGEWILILDADEELADYKKLVEFLNNKENNKYNTAYIMCRSFLNSNCNTYVDGHIRRLFKNNKEFCYEGIIHEQPKEILPVIKTNIVINHYGYLSDDCNLMIYKFERNLKLLQKDLEKSISPEYTKFQMYQSYAMANKMEEAQNIIRSQYYRNKNNKDYTIAFNYGKTLFEAGEYGKVIEVIEKLKKEYSNIDISFLLGSSYYFMKQYKNAAYELTCYLNDYNKEQYFEIYSYEYKEKVKEMLIESLYNLHEYNKLIEVYEDINEEKVIKLREMYIYSLMKTKRLKNYCVNTDLDDNDIECIINSLERYNLLEEEGYLEIINDILRVNKRLEYILYKIYLHKEFEYDLSSINFNKYNLWKARLIKELFLKDINSIFLLEDLTSDVIRKYIDYLLTDYYCLKNLYKVSREWILQIDYNNYNKLKLLIEIERKVLLCECIDYNDYYNLVVRAGVNNINLLKHNKYYNNRLNESDKYHKFWIEMRNVKNSYNTLEYSNEVRSLINKYPEYIKIIKAFIKLKDIKYISKEMIAQKDNFLEQLETIVKSEKLNNVLIVLKEFNKLFYYDEKIIMNIGVIYYFLGNIEEALSYLLRAYFINDNNDDIIYNLHHIIKEYKKHKCNIK